MSNLITEKQKKIVKNDYWVRVSVVVILLASLLGLFLLAYIIPYYLSVIKKDLKVAEQFESVINLENKENTGENMAQIVAQTLEKMKAIEIYNNGFKPSIFFTKIVENKNKDISLTKLSFDFLKKDQVKFLVSGISLSREGLVLFIDDLKAKAGFTNVDLPISDFAKDSNISFTLNIITQI